MLATVAVVLAGCDAGVEEHAVEACSLLQDHLDAMRGGEERGEGLQLAQDAFDAAERSNDGELADMLGDYQRVIVRFAFEADNVRLAEEGLEQATDDDRDQLEDDLASAQARLAELIEAGDLVLTQVGLGCQEHGVPLE